MSAEDRSNCVIFEKLKSTTIHKAAPMEVVESSDGKGVKAKTSVGGVQYVTTPRFAFEGQYWLSPNCRSSKEGVAASVAATPWSLTKTDWLVFL
jgi:hypothetical protein